jgi:hypothetical protein
MALNGYYTLLAMVMNAARTAPSAAASSPLAPLPPRTWYA